MPEVILQSSDRENFTVDVEVAKMSSSVKRLLRSFQYKEEDLLAGEVIPLDVDGGTLRLVLGWCEKHKDDAEEEAGENRTDDISRWDQAFLEVPLGTLFALIMAGNYLHIKGLLDLCVREAIKRLQE